MRLVFMGSSPLSRACLAHILTAGQDEVVAVVAPPPRGRGRHHVLTQNEVDRFAKETGLPVLTPESVNAPEGFNPIEDLLPDVIVVVAFGQILKQPLLDLPPEGCLNIHASLLPCYRGAAPVQWAIAQGESTTGLTSMYMARAMDAGDIIFQTQLLIHPDETAGRLLRRIEPKAGDLLVRTLDAIRNGTAPRTVQEDARVTFAPKLKKSDGRIDWTRPATTLYNCIRGFDPWPGTVCGVPDRKHRHLKVLRSRVELAPTQIAPGTLLTTEGEGPLVMTGEGALRLLNVQPEGKTAMTGEAYCRGHQLKVGEVLE